MIIYKFTHIATGRCYIGQTIQEANRRRLEHISHSRSSPKTYHFHNALRKYGFEAFTFEVIATAASLDELNLLEEKFTVEYDSIENGFNIRQPGGNKKHHPDSIARMSKAQTDAHARRREAGNDTWTRKDGGAMLGKKQSAHQRKIMSELAKKRTYSEETRRKMSESAKNRKTKDTVL